jgi:ribosome recycling factor
VGLLRNTEKVFCGHGGYRSMSSLHQPKIFHLPAIGSPSFPSWCIISEKKGSVIINEDEIAELVKVSSLKQDLQKGLDQLKSDYVKHLSLRSASGRVIKFTILCNVLFVNLKHNFYRVYRKP